MRKPGYFAYILFIYFYLAMILFSGCTGGGGDDSSSGSDNSTPVDPGDTAAPTVVGFYPGDGSTDVVLNTTIVVTFSEAMNTSTITVNTSGTTCSGSIQVSKDNFSTCVQASSDPVAGVENKAFTVTLTSNLEGNTTYKTKILVTATDSAGNALTETVMVNGFTSLLDSTSPTVVEFIPVFGSTDVAVNVLGSITFSEAMDPSTITINTTDNTCSGSIQVSKDNFGTCVMANDPTASNGNKTFTLSPKSNLENDTTYKARITGNAKDAVGNAYAGTDPNAIPSFTTGSASDATAPMVVEIIPPNGDTDVAINLVGSVTFDEAMDSSTITVNTTDSTCSGSLQISKDDFANCVRAAGDPEAGNGNKTFTLSPLTSLEHNTTYKAKITSAAKDLAGNAYAGTDSNAIPSFSTGAAPDTTAPSVAEFVPANGSTGVAINLVWSITFNEAMNPSTITTNIDTTCSGSVQVSKDNFATCIRMTGSPTAGSGDKTFTLSTASNLAYSTTYKIRITSAAKDLSGNAHPGTDPNAIPSLTTGAAPDTTAPLVTEFVPVNGATDVAINVVGTVTFNEAMNPSTITGNIDTTCSGSIQVSKDNFTTCVPMAGSPSAGNGGKTFTLSSASNLDYNSTYEARITNVA